MKGSIQKRVSKRGDVTWYAVVDLPPDPATGKRRQKRLSAPKKRDLELLIAATLKEAENGTLDGGKVPVRDFLDQWLDSAQSTLRPSTHRRYTDLMRQHVAPIIGGIPLGKLAPLDIQRLYDDRLTCLSPTTVNQIHNILHRALKQAMRWGLIGRNVTEAVDVPRPANPEMKTWNTQHVAAVLAAAKADELEALWRLALLTGMRRGELLGLKWEDIDLDRGTLSVRRTLSRGEGGT